MLTGSWRRRWLRRSWQIRSSPSFSLNERWEHGKPVTKEKTGTGRRRRDLHQREQCEEKHRSHWRSIGTRLRSRLLGLVRISRISFSRPRVIVDVDGDCWRCTVHVLPRDQDDQTGDKQAALRALRSRIAE